MGSSLQQNLVFLLHGFLGQGQDWDAVQTEVHEELAWIKPDLFSKQALPIADYEIYVDRLMQHYEGQIKNFHKKIFVGYSLGGRLGLYILKKYADRFDHFVFVSTNPGLQDVKERTERQTSDLVWADKIKNQSWSKFLTEWNSQPVFSKADPEPARDEKNFDTKKLAQSMDVWSLAVQDDMRALIQKHQNKITWVVGDQDLKFLNLAEDLKQKKILLGFNKIFSGHRILFSNPKELAQIIQKLL